MPTVTINIAGRGTPLAEGGTSSVGHMWYELTDDAGQTTSYGFAPDVAHHGKPFAPGQIYHNDSTNYQDRAYTKTVEITQEQFDAMERFGEDPEEGGFSKWYNGLTNSCVDFTWKALEKGGLNPSGFEGAIWPTHNIGAVKKITNPALAAATAKGVSSKGSTSSQEGSGGIKQTCLGAMMTCSFGAAPSSLIPTPKQINTSYVPAANIMDNVPIANIPPFGMCSSPANPAVAAATAAAMGVLTPMPCVPVFPAPWVPGAATVMLNNMPALNNTSMLMCAYGGVVQFSNAGQATHNIP